MEYAYAGDMAYVCVGEGTVLMQNDTQGLIHEEDIRNLFRETEKKKKREPAVSVCRRKLSYKLLHHTKAVGI